jgi:dihydroorotate dehydrogenase (NAD+) catalytic subunit
MTIPDLSVDIGGLMLQNPVMTASGTFGYAMEFKSLIDLNRLGGAIVKGLSLEPTKGNPPPRIFETPCGMLNAIGLENVGVEAFIEKKVPSLSKLEIPVLANIYGHTVDAYGLLAERLDGIEALAGIEINISCPNVKQGGVAFGTDARMAHKVVQTVRRRYGGYVMVKLSPNVTDITEIAKSVEDAGGLPISPAAYPDRRSGPWPCGWFGRSPRRSRSRSSVSAVLCAPKMPWNSSLPAPPPFRWGPPTS